MKVVHILGELKFSGAEMLLSSAAEYLIGTENEHTIISTGPAVGEYSRILADAGYDIVHLPLSKSPGFFLKLFRALRAGRYDLAHIHMEKASLWNAIVVRLAGMAGVRTIHNAFQFEGNLRIRRMLGRKAAQSIGIVHVACSPAVAQNERERFGIEVETIDNWLDPKRIQPRTPQSRSAARSLLGMSQSDFVVVSVGNYGPAKNHEAIVDGVRACVDRLPIHYYHCGAGGDRLRQARDVQDSEPITMAGAVTNVSDYLLAADAFISASFFEGGQVSLLEAAASGTPCVTTKVGLAELFEGMAGVIFVENTSVDISRGITALYAIDPQQRYANGMALATLVLTHFIPQVGASNYLNLYRRLVV